MHYLHVNGRYMWTSRQSEILASSRRHKEGEPCAYLSVTKVYNRSQRVPFSVSDTFFVSWLTTGPNQAGLGRHQRDGTGSPLRLSETR